MSGPETPGDAPVRAPLTDDIDMTGVDPLRWDEVRRRIAVIKAYLAVPFPTEADRKNHACQLDRSVNQFMALVRAWREHGSAARIAASGAHRRGPRQASLSVDPVAREVAADTIDELGAGATLAEVSRKVGERCAARGVAPPSNSTIWNMARADRRSRRSEETGVLIGTCMVRLPMETSGGLSHPMLTIAVRAADKAILAASLGKADWTTAAMAIASTSSNGDEVRADKVLIRLKRASSIASGVDPVPGAKVRSAMSRILGPGLDDLRLIYRLGKAMPAERLLTTREDRPLSPADARTVIARAVSRHNAAMGAREASWLDTANPSPAA